MQIIPVIDIRGGVAVRAIAGDRAKYQNLETPLVRGSDPCAVATALHALGEMSVLYAADLDGIEQSKPNRTMQERLLHAWPGAEVWIDDGTSDELAHPLATQARCLPRHVIGSESVKSVPQTPLQRDSILSLDFRGTQFLGPPTLLANPSLWPDRVIVMTLSHIGTNKGPDMSRLRSVLDRAGRRSIFAAGGVRHREDLEALKELGASGALVSSALHSGSLTSADLKATADNTV